RQAMYDITDGWRQPSELLKGGKSTLFQLLVKNSVRNASWLKRAALEEAYPGASDYVIPASAAFTEFVLTPSVFRRARIQFTGQTLVEAGLGEQFSGALPGVLKVTATTTIYMRVKPHGDKFAEALNLPCNTVWGKFASAAFTTVPVTVLTHPLELVRFRMQRPVTDTSPRLGFFKTTSDVLAASSGLLRTQGVTQALRFLLRGCPAAGATNLLYTILFNEMVRIGEEEANAALSSRTPSNSP
ncbi:MAG: hypothetical protein P1U32_09045, partial [Legionellaceae bacterium]|nr:hypothetical protein [Legionellaceae bacterium]